MGKSAIRKISAVLATVAIAVSLTGCEGSAAQEEGQKLTEQAFEQQQSAVPYPVDELTDSLERRNVRERLLRTNDPDKIGYVYMMSFGKFMGYYTVKGKVSSTQSQMTTGDLAIRPCSGCDRVVVGAPGDDGSYRENEEGIFFFTTNGTYVTTNLDYVYSDAPLALNVPELEADTQE